MGNLAVSTKAASAPAGSDFKFIVARQDDGKASVTLYYKGSVALDPKGVKIQQLDAGWDDSIPWAARTGIATSFILEDTSKAANTIQAHPRWELSDIADRQGVQMHLGKLPTATDPNIVTNPLEGCIGVSSDFLDRAEAAISLKNQLYLSTPMDVTGDYGITVSTSLSDTALNEGDDATFKISLSGSGSSNGVTKDLWFHVPIAKTGAAGVASYTTDYDIRPVDGGDVTLQSADFSKKPPAWQAGYFVKLPKGKTSASYTIHSISDNLVEKPETIDLTIDDYFAVRTKLGKDWRYSDELIQPTGGVLLKGGTYTKTITLSDVPKLTKLTYHGSSEGKHIDLAVTPGDTVTWEFEAYSIPDSLDLSDGITHSQTAGYVSGFHTGSLVAGTDHIRLDLFGNSDPDTLWDLTLTAKAGIKVTSLPLVTEDGDGVAADAGAGTVQGVAAPPIVLPGATIALVSSTALIVGTGGSETAAVSFNVVAGKEYFIRLTDGGTTAGTLANGYLKVFDGSTTAFLESHQSDLSGQPGVFFRATASGQATFRVGSDVSGAGGDAVVELYDVSAVATPFLYLEANGTAAVAEDDERGISVRLHRGGDISGTATYRVIITPTGAHPISAADVDAGGLVRTITFAPGQTLAEAVIAPVDDGVAEGQETATVTLDTSGFSAATIANNALLGFGTSADIVIADPDQIVGLNYPVLGSVNATGAEKSGKLTFNVTLTASPSFRSQVQFSTVDGTGVAGKDYVPISGTLTFDPGETVKQITVDLLKDPQVEADKTFSMKFLAPFGLNLPAANATVLTSTGTITDTVATAGIGIANGTTKQNSLVSMDDAGAGGPGYLLSQWIYNGTDDLAVSTPAANVFVHTGSGSDAIQVTSGQNVLDGGLGSNFLTGGSGTDTFFTDSRNPGVVWNTIRNFHTGDAATLWGFTPGVSSYRWEANLAGAAGSQGATLRANIVGGAGRTGDGVDASITFTGLSVAQAQKLQFVTGTQPGGTYLFIYNPGV